MEINTEIKGRLNSERPTKTIFDSFILVEGTMYNHCEFSVMLQTENHLSPHVFPVRRERYTENKK